MYSVVDDTVVHALRPPGYFVSAAEARYHYGLLQAFLEQYPWYSAEHAVRHGWYLPKRLRKFPPSSRFYCFGSSATGVPLLPWPENVFFTREEALCNLSGK